MLFSESLIFYIIFPGFVSRNNDRHESSPRGDGDYGGFRNNDQYERRSGGGRNSSDNNRGGLKILKDLKILKS
jgi:hypothetical protein